MVLIKLLLIKFQVSAVVYVDLDSYWICICVDLCQIVNGIFACGGIWGGRIPYKSMGFLGFCGGICGGIFWAKSDTVAGPSGG